MNSYLVSKTSSFYVANLRNSQLLRAIRALKLDILNHNLLRSEKIRGSLNCFWFVYITQQNGLVGPANRSGILHAVI